MWVRFIHLFLIFNLLTIGRYVYGQAISIRTSINVLPPYSLYLADYVSPGSNRLNVNIVVNDANPADLTAKLKLTILGEGVTIETKPNFTPTPIRLSTGVNVITTADLISYFDPANLNFQGLDKAQFVKSGRLKEGIYQFCIEAVEYNRGVKLSDKACATAWLILNNPPIWNLPGDNEIVRATNPQNMLFNWTPQHTGSPNSAFTTEYEFTMVEIWPLNRNPNDAINSQLPFYRATTNQNSLFFGPAEPPFIPGRKYAVRLRAYDKDGRDLFVNNGYSEVRVFTFGEECKPPVAPTVIVENFQRAKVTWATQSSQTDFSIRYRPFSDNPDAPWYIKNTIYSNAIIDSLKDGIKYEYNMRANCGSISSGYTPSDTFRLPLRPLRDFECKDEVYNPAQSGATLKTTLTVGDRINVGGFEVALTEVSGNNGIFSGKGVVVIPFMNNVPVSANFSQIKVNENNKVIAGNINVDRAGLQILNSSDRDKIHDSFDNIDQKFDDLTSYLDKTNSIVREVDKIIADVPQASKALMDKGKQLIEEGKLMIDGGNTEGGKALIEKGKEQIKQGVKDAMNGQTPSEQNEGIDLAGLFRRKVTEKRDTVLTDSIAIAKALQKEIKEYEAEKADFNEEPLIASNDSSDEASEAISEIDYDVAMEVVEVKSIDKGADPKILDLNSRYNNIEKKRLNLEKLEDVILILTKTLNDEARLKLWLESFKKDAAKFLKGLVIESLTSTQQVNLESEMKKFIDRKVNELVDQ